MHLFCNGFILFCNGFLLLLVIAVDGYRIKGEKVKQAVDKRDDTGDIKWLIGSNGRLYHTAETALDFYRSSDHCESVGGTLATILNEKDQLAIDEIIKQTKSDLMWIGLFQGNGQDHWTWNSENGDIPSSDYTNWDAGQPQGNNALEDCVAVEDDGKWTVASCDDKFKAICQKGQPKDNPQLGGKEKDKPAAWQQKQLSEQSTSQSQSQSQSQLQTSNLPNSPSQLQSGNGFADVTQLAQIASTTNTAQSASRCALLNFLNHVGKPVKIFRVVNDETIKGIVVTEDSYKLKTVFKRVQNIQRMKPVEYYARDSKTDERLWLDGMESLTLIPGDCNADFIDITITPMAEEDSKKDDEPAGIIVEENPVDRHHVPEEVERHHVPEEVIHMSKTIHIPKTVEDDEATRKSNVSIKSEQTENKKCELETFGGNSEGSCCHLPFKANDKLHIECTSEGSRHLWCGTTSNYDKDKKWTYCCFKNECSK